MLDATDQQYFQNLKHLWALFRETGEISPEVRPMIASSWMRSRDFHVDMMKPLRAPILSRPELQALQATNQTLIDLAKPIMEKMHSLVGKTKNLISLHNPDGYMGMRRLKNLNTTATVSPTSRWKVLPWQA